MKQVLYTILLTLASLKCQCQLYDNVWVAGDSPLSFISFGGDSITIDSINNNIFGFIQTVANICDENGQLLYLTNGTAIVNDQGDTIQNGTGINPCDYTRQYLCCGLDIVQAALFIPQPGNNRYYYLFHFSNDDAGSSRPATIYCSLIDKEGNGGQGAVIKKNDTVLHVIQLRGGGMTACKHANGRDYWLVIGGSVVNTFYKFLVTPNGIHGPYAQSIGPEFPGPYDNAYSRFSQDGSKYVTGVYEGPILVMDFDRCSGEFSNPITIYNQGCDSPQTCSASSSVEFSPNNRFVYVADVINLNQYDLWASDIQGSVVQLYSDSVDHTNTGELNTLQLAPDGKIYISSWNGLLTYDSLHVINNPDVKGDSCNFKYASQPTYSHNNNIPNMTNYRLGALVGSGCDTITAIQRPTTNSQRPRIIPNPANKYTYVEMGMQGNYEFDLLNVTGQVIERKETMQVANFDTENLSSGVYFLQVLDKTTRQKMSSKLVVVH